MKQWVTLLITVWCLSLSGCAKTVSIDQMQTDKIQTNRAGELMKMFSSPSSLVIAFTYDENRSKITIKKIYKESESPSEEAVLKVLQDNLQTYKTNKTIDDFLFIDTKGGYSCLYCEKRQSNEFLSVFYDYEINDPIGTTIASVFVPLNLLLGNTRLPQYTSQIVSRNRINMFGRIVETEIVNQIDAKIAKLHTADDYFNFVEIYTNHPRIHELKAEGIQLLRKENTFASYSKAFRLSSAKQDFENMGRTAKTSAEKRQYEATALLFAKDKNTFFSLSASASPYRTEENSGGGGLFKKMATVKRRNFIVDIALQERAGLDLEFSYKVILEVKTTMILSCYRASNWMGTGWYDDNIVDTKTVQLELHPGKTSRTNLETSFFTINYADVGLMNGHTQCTVKQDPITTVNIKEIIPL